MAEDNQEQKQDPKKIQEFLQRLSKDKHAFGAHMGMHVDRDFTELEKQELANEANKKAKSNKKP